VTLVSWAIAQKPASNEPTLSAEPDAGGHVAAGAVVGAWVAGTGVGVEEVLLHAPTTIAAIAAIATNLELAFM
jgi:hypothetical protein